MSSSGIPNSLLGGGDLMTGVELCPDKSKIQILTPNLGHNNSGPSLIQKELNCIGLQHNTMAHPVYPTPDVPKNFPPCREDEESLPPKPVEQRSKKKKQVIEILGYPNLLETPPNLGKRRKKKGISSYSKVLTISDQYTTNSRMKIETMVRREDNSSTGSSQSNANLNSKKE
ncbi:hypothetical protein RHGRI_015533 [Rhododendron griersonianum]|uniref:Uncharacterized protein n=1 Tax=Rhododendron griersonianum TaxID=479676 RepID=A0AAV6KDN2_9ERIC|nr:hypothetical protein RHGRI_015533 [Rhododendron griersonianum]